MGIMRSSRQLRLLRGSVAASVATFVALMSHVAGGGQAPGWLSVVVSWVLSLAVCTVLAGRQLSRRRLSISVAASQALFHTLFVLGAGAVSGSTMTGGHAGHSGHMTMVMTSPTGSDTVQMIQADPTMWFWHAIAAVATVAVLYRGERALLRMRDLAGQLVAWVRRRFGVTTLPVLVLASARTVPADSERVVVPGPQLSPLRRRGPPSLRVI